ncbi:MAG: hypothetical protein DRO14_01770 [Thermoprotei archaeon]|nr:MAG: hypothetical protein DRO14_01770 [Thermoprotei archaeon]
MIKESGVCIPIDKSELINLICYPSTDRKCFEDRSRKLAEHGVKCIVSEGRRNIGNVKVLGKGHSAVVVKIMHRRYGEVALKLRRSDSKRGDLALECKLMISAVPIAPVPLVCSDDFIVMEFVDGTHLEESIRGIISCRDAVLLVAKVLAAAFWLDTVGIEHKELSIADKHVMLTKDGRVKIIDYESASHHSRPCNLCSLFSWLIVRRRVLRRFCRVGDDFIQELIRLVREYKLSTTIEERRELLVALVKKLCKLIVHHNP